MKYFNNLPEKLKMQKAVKDLAAKIAGNDYPANFVINIATKRIYNFGASGTKAIKEGNEFVAYSFLDHKDFGELKQYPIKELFEF